MLIALLCISLWTVMYLRVADKVIGIDKDYMYLYLCGIEMIDPSQQDQQTQLTEQLVAAGANDHLLYRARMRESYCNNYPFTSLSMYLSGSIQIRLGITDPAKDFPEFVANAMWWGLMLSGGVLGLLCLLIVFSVAGDTLLLAMAGALAVAALLYLALPPPSLSWFLLQSTPARIVNLPNTLGISAYSWLNPTAVFSPFSAFPRCLCAMLAFAAFALRWSGRNALAYWAPFLVSFVHQSEAPILLATMICCDAVPQPAAWPRIKVLLPIGLTVVTIALREHMHSILGFSGPSGLPAVVLSLVVVVSVTLVVAVPRLRSVLISVWKAGEQWRLGLVRRFPLPTCDALVILAIWLAVFLVSYIVSRHDNMYRIIYFWSELPSRYVGLFQLPVFVGLAYPAFTALAGSNPVRSGTAIISCLALAFAIGASGWTFNGPAVATKWANTVEQWIAKNYAGDQGGYSRIETPWYYLMVRHAYLGGKTISDYFGKGS